jgi:hypothetical protein
MKGLVVFALVGLTAAPVAAQGRGRNNTQGIPPGHMPPPGECRVWHDGVPPGRQPAPTNCNEAERIASRSSNTRVIYGDDRGGWDRYDPRDRDRYDPQGSNGTWGRDDSRPRNGRPAEGRAIPRDQSPGTYGYPDSRYPARRGASGTLAFRNGYQDGITKAQEDTRDNDAFDPARHGWYKSANRGYESRYGTREQYAAEYRDGFLEGYRQNYRGRTDSRGGWWPF